MLHICPFMTSIMLGIGKSLFVLGWGGKTLGTQIDQRERHEERKCKREMKREETEENCYFSLLGVSFKKGKEKKMLITY